MADEQQPKTVPARDRDVCVVPTEPLSALVRQFVTRWNVDHPQTSGQFSAGGRSRKGAPVSAVSYLAREAALHPLTVQKIVQGRYRYTELRIADPLVARGLARPDLVGSLALPVIPNPGVRAERRAECCTGSGDALNGSLGF